MGSCRREFLTGVLSPSSWDKNDEIDGYSIFTEEEEDVILEGRDLERNFETFKNKKVRVSGKFLKTLNEERVFEVSKTMPWGEVA